MDEKTLDALETGVERLIEAYTAVRSENNRLREELEGLKSRQELFRSRLDLLIAKIDGVVSQ